MQTFFYPDCRICPAALFRQKGYGAEPDDRPAPQNRYRLLLTAVTSSLCRVVHRGMMPRRRRRRRTPGMDHRNRRTNHHRRRIDQPRHCMDDLRRSILFPVMFPCHQIRPEKGNCNTGGDHQYFNHILFHFLSPFHWFSGRFFCLHQLLRISELFYFTKYQKK